MTLSEQLAEQIKLYPEKHRHEDINELISCCMIEGAVDLTLMQAHQDYVDYGSNGGVKCDMVKGPCACGGWH